MDHGGDSGVPTFRRLLRRGRDPTYKPRSGIHATGAFRQSRAVAGMDRFGATPAPSRRTAVRAPAYRHGSVVRASPGRCAPGKAFQAVSADLLSHLPLEPGCAGDTVHADQRLEPAHWPGSTVRLRSPGVADGLCGHAAVCQGGVQLAVSMSKSHRS